MGRQETLEVYRKLLRKPMSVLRRFAVDIGQLGGYDSTECQLAFSASPELIRIGTHEFCAKSPDPWSEETDEESVIDVPAIASPMRFEGAPERLLRTARMRPRRAEIWATEQQTGCTVLILDWGRGKLSMIHLRPDDDAEFNRLTQWMMSGESTTAEYFKAAYKNFWLKQESTEIVGKSHKRTPERYIMVQSAFATMRTYRTQLLGVYTGGNWEFFKQSYQMRARGGYERVTVTQLTWTTWRAWVPYWTQ